MSDCNRYKFYTDEDTGEVCKIIEIRDVDGVVLNPGNVITPDNGVTNSEGVGFVDLIPLLGCCDDEFALIQDCEICFIDPKDPKTKVTGKETKFYVKTPDADGDGTSNITVKQVEVMIPGQPLYTAHYNSDGTLDTESGTKPEYTLGACSTSLSSHSAC